MAEIWRGFIDILAPLKPRTNASEHRIELPTGGVIELWSMENADVIRGRKYKRFIIDEAAQVADLKRIWNEVIRPTLVDQHGDARFLSTPKGLNAFHEFFQWGQDPEGHPDWQSWQMPTTANPFIDPAEVEAARRESPEQYFAQEYMAQFLDMEGSVFRKIQEAATVEPVTEAVEGHNYAFGVDWGKLNDWTVITVLDLTTNQLVCFERFNQIDYQVQLGRLKDLYGRFHPLVVKPEANSIGEPLIEQLNNEGLPVVPFTTTAATKQVVIDALVLAFERGDIAIPNDPVLIGELLAFEATRMPSGQLRYGAPAGMHDDCVMSLALAWSCREAQQDWTAAYHLSRCPHCGKLYYNPTGGAPCSFCRKAA